MPERLTYDEAVAAMRKAVRRAAMRRHMKECPFTSALGRALWRALF